MNMNQNQKYLLDQSYIFGTLIVIQFFMYFMYLRTESYIFLGTYFLISLPLLMVLLNKAINQKFFLLLGLITLILATFGLFSQEFPTLITYYNLLYGISSLITAYALFTLRNSETFIKILFWCYTSLILYYFYAFGFSDPDLYNEVLKGSSRNYLSAIFVILLALLALSFEKIKKPTPLIYPLVTFICCVGLFGRSGIVFSLVMLIFIMARQKNYKLIGVFFATIIVICIIKFNTIINFIELNTNFTNGLSSERSIFLTEYLTGIMHNNSDFFFGRKLSDCCSWIQSFQNNPHNSFIMGHLRYGIAHTLLSVGILIYIVLSRNLTLTLFGVVILSRFFVDQLGLFTPYDTVLFFLLFIIHSNNTIKKSA
ncbi:hypothetical protein DJ533_11960 [Acinetobacter defluvii]|uniref:O-antigen ligase family protein n=1 Tax=Acinetobacter defluvii TaxID=1871111 RepID=A0A2S2FEA0_9GAMM|nr:hypothetical protein [Acinetobacter defluvii]AWL29230.2 hypothetical protein DJ533_11960 [Acinetobacter defluvii]